MNETLPSVWISNGLSNNICTPYYNPDHPLIHYFQHELANYSYVSIVLWRTKPNTITLAGGRGVRYRINTYHERE